MEFSFFWGLVKFSRLFWSGEVAVQPLTGLRQVWLDPGLAGGPCGRPRSTLRHCSQGHVCVCERDSARALVAQATPIDSTSATEGSFVAYECASTTTSSLYLIAPSLTSEVYWRIQRSPSCYTAAPDKSSPSEEEHTSIYPLIQIH